MNTIVLLIVVAFQILVFQFLGVRLSRLLPDYLVGVRDLPPETNAAIAAYRGRIGRGRRWIGATLLLILGLTTVGVGTPAVRRLVIAGVSLISTAVFLAGYVRDRRLASLLAASLPPPTARTATLERATLSEHYRIRRELLPVVVWIATLAVTVMAMRAGRADLFTLAVLQSGVVVGGLALSLWYARWGPRLSQRARAHLGEPEAALQLDRRLRTLELRAFLAARIGIVLLLAVKQAQKALPALGLHAAGVLTVAEWAMIVGMLGIFAAHVMQLSRVRVARSSGHYEGVA